MSDGLRDALGFIWNNNDEEYVEWIWDELKQDFKKEKIKKDDWFNPVCECGSEKTYGKDATHSEWCAKYKKIK